MASRPAHKLLAVLGVTFGLAVTVGNTIGAGILRTPGTVAELLPTFWLFIAVWIAGGAYALLGANALAELGAMIPRSGGQYVFVQRGLGDYAGFIVGWSDWLSTCGTTAAVALVVGEYATVLAPQLGSPTATALFVIAALTIVQWFGTRAGSAAQTAASVAKALALLVLIAACFFLGGRNPAARTLEPLAEGSLVIAFLLALQSVIYTYDGWSAMIYFSGEVKRPGRDIARSMFGGVLLVIAIYLLLNVAFLRVVPLATIAGDPFAASVVATHLFGYRGDAILRILMVVSLVSAVNSNVLMAPRVLFAMSGDGLFWRGASEVNRGGTPDVALLISSLLAGVFVATGTFEAVVARLAFFFVANYALSFTTLFVLRRREPDTPRPFRAWGHPFTTGLALAASVAFLLGAAASDPANSLVAIVLLALTVPLFLLVRFSNDHELSTR
ncbi:MAG TPA: APC family permease [Thermoanaerobaculia bacterium]|nr:APC family permease [Thermoanaerobaculia bacterium]